MKMKNGLVVALLVGLSLGCATGRVVNQDGSVSSEPIKLGWANSHFQPGLERRTDQVVSRVQGRQESEVWHQTALEAAKTGEVIKPPAAGVDGVFPVVFINDSWETRSFDYWRDENSVRYNIVVPGRNSHGLPNYQVVYLRSGWYCFSIYDSAGRKIRLAETRNDPGSEVKAFPVKARPSHEYLGQKYFGRVRTF
ncbi:MAG: hypothetical protein WCW26_00405 [Candidatus Buchananbacteria bacterium]